MDWDHLHRHLLETLETLTTPEEARAEARLWLEDGFKRDQAWLTLHGEDPVNRDDQQRFHTWLERRKRREPCQYLWGGTLFRNRRFRCDPRVLIPRPETELIIEEALARRPAETPIRVWDVGTGSGIIAVTLALETQWTLTASDVSLDALACAKENALHHQVSLQFVEGDLLQAHGDPVDLVISNLPYVSPLTRDQLQPELYFEPALALYAPEEGYALEERLLREGKHRSVPLMILEIGAGQAERLKPLAREIGWPHVETSHDWNGHDRVLVVEQPVSKIGK